MNLVALMEEIRNEFGISKGDMNFPDACSMWALLTSQLPRPYSV